MDRFLDSVDFTKRAHSKSVQSDLNTCRDRIHALTRDKVILSHEYFEI